MLTMIIDCGSRWTDTEQKQKETLLIHRLNINKTADFIRMKRG
jgi:hypothetical protein